MIRQYLKKIKDLINDNNIEITSHSNINTSGIYMIYLDDFSSTTTIPFYIGQTTNFQKRHSQHYKELLSLNRLSYETYKKLFFFSENNRGCFYDGSFKSCKIFQYMIDHGLNLSHWHMIIIEECSQDKLNEREQYYFEYLTFGLLHSYI